MTMSGWLTFADGYKAWYEVLECKTMVAEINIHGDVVKVEVDR